MLFRQEKSPSEQSQGPAALSLRFVPVCSTQWPSVQAQASAFSSLGAGFTVLVALRDGPGRFVTVRRLIAFYGVHLSLGAGQVANVRSIRWLLTQRS